ncbi:MAG: HAD family phosphatase [Gammaproteobacteria bacterium]|nr:HAD family phosphatase [Gammaproteobacteria bacterium]
MKALIVFDLGGVLIDWDPRYLYRKLFSGDDAAMEHFLTEICSPAWNVQQDAGRPLAVATEELVSRYPQQRELIKAFYGRWEEMLGGAIEASVAILQEVKNLGFPVVALSNWSAETFSLARKRYDFLNWFDDLVISGIEKVAKPDPEIYQILLKRTGRNAENCIFIDDSLMNISAAKGLGFVTIHYQSPDQLREELSLLCPGLAVLNT